MPYDPKASSLGDIEAKQRERLYWLTLLSGLGNVAVLGLYLYGADTILLGWLVGGIVGALLVAGFRGHTDDYYNQLITSGLRLMAFGLGIMLLLLWIHAETALLVRLMPGIATLAADAFMLALILALLFHGGYAFAFLRDRLPTGERE